MMIGELWVNMGFFFVLIVYTCNVLSLFNNPFEFDGDYGSEINSIRQQIFEKIIPREALVTNLTDFEIKQIMEKEGVTSTDMEIYRENLILQAIIEDNQHGPTLGELVSTELINDLKHEQNKFQNFSNAEMQDIMKFVEKYKNIFVFRFLHKIPSEFLSLDKVLSDKTAQKGSKFSLPTVTSTTKLKGKTSYELKNNLLRSTYNEETFSLTKTKETLKNSLEKFDEELLCELLGSEAKIEDFDFFCSASGQVFLYWLYHSMNLHLISQDQQMIDDVNLVKERFIQTLGNPKHRAETLKNKLMETNASVLFVQESDFFTCQELVENGLFLPVYEQNPRDGCFVFLRSNCWEPSYEMLSIDGYDGFQKGKLNLILATLYTGEKFLLSSAHGNSIHAEDGRLQIYLIMKEFNRIKQERGYDNLQLIIGMDANTKTEKDVNAFRDYLDKLGLVGTNVGPTTVKKRMVSVQHTKVGKLSVDEEDYLITLKNESGGKYSLTDLTIGFNSESANLDRMLPNIDNLSDHYPVGANLKKTIKNS